MTSPLEPQLRPNLIGIGAPKCGTTHFCDLLARHPDIFMPAQKELNALYYNDLDDRLEEYSNHFRLAGRHRIRCDFSVRYISERNAVRAAARICPDAKVIAVLRDPVDQVQSHYWHQVRQNFSQPIPINPVPDIFSALIRYPSILEKPALYHSNLKMWREYFPSEQILLLDYNSLTKDPEATLRAVCCFLELEWSDHLSVQRAAQRTHRRGVSPRGGLLGAVYPVLYSAVTRGPYQSLKRRLGVARVEAIKRRLKLRETSEMLFFKTGYRKLSEEERKRLAALFFDEVQHLIESGFDSAKAWTKP